MNPLAWTTTLPSGWDVRPLRHLATVRNSSVDKHSREGETPVRLCNYTDVYDNDVITPDLELMRATATRRELRRFELRAGDVLITKDSETWDDIGVPACVAEDMPGVVCGYHLTLLRPRADVIEGRFLSRAMQASGVRDQLWLAASGVTRFGLDLRGMKDVLIPVPPRAVQRRVADLLDQKTVAVDALIACKQRLIARLAEKRAALLHHALARLDAPAVKLGYLLDLLPGYAFPSAGYSSAPDDVPLLRGVNIAPGALRWDDVVRWPRERVGAARRWQLQAGDIVLGLDRPWIAAGLRVARLGAGDVPALLLQRVARMRCGRRLAPEYLLLTLEAPRFRNHVEPGSTGVSVPHISPSQVLSYRVPLPTYAVQERLAASLRSALARDRLVRDREQRSIARLREYRQALITAAVTGQLDGADNLRCG